MHPLAANLIVESVRRRVRQGDCPTEPAQSVESLEETILELAHRLSSAGSSASPLSEEERERLVEAVCSARYQKNNAKGERLRREWNETYEERLVRLIDRLSASAPSPEGKGSEDRSTAFIAFIGKGENSLGRYPANLTELAAAVREFDRIAGSAQ